MLANKEKIYINKQITIMVSARSLGHRTLWTSSLYIIYLYQVKEALEIKRSRVTYTRKWKMNKVKYTKATIMSVQKIEIERGDLGFKALKNIKGTTTYF